jgi:hypothetical protein
VIFDLCDVVRHSLEVSDLAWILNMRFVAFQRIRAVDQPSGEPAGKNHRQE